MLVADPFPWAVVDLQSDGPSTFLSLYSLSTETQNACCPERPVSSVHWKHVLLRLDSVNYNKMCQGDPMRNPNDPLLHYLKTFDPVISVCIDCNMMNSAIS